MHKIFLMFLLAFQTFGQVKFPVNYHLSTLNGDDGLSQVSNYFRYEDSRGFMWITANDALNRYDGSYIKVYNLNRYFKNCPNLQQGYGFAEDAESNIYVGSERGLYIYTRSTDKFTLQKIFKNSPDEIAMPFAFDNGKIWCFNRFYELATYDVKTHEVKIEAKIPIESINSIHVYQLPHNVFYYRWPFLDNAGNVWIVGKTQVIKYQTKSKKVSFPIVKKQTDVQHEFFSSVLNKNLLIIGTNKGLLTYEMLTGKSKSIEKLGQKHLGLVNSLSAFQNMVAFKSDDEIALLDFNTNQQQWVWPNNSPKTRAIIYFTFDKMGRLWTTDNGLEQKIFSFKNKLLKKIPEESDDEAILSTNSVGYIVEQPDGDILIQGIWKIDKKSGTILRANKFEKYRRAFVSFDKKGVWFLNSVNNSNSFLSFIDKNNKSTNYIRDKDRTLVGEIQDLARFSDGKTLLSSANGLFWLNKEKNTIQVVNNIPNAFKINELSQNRLAVSYLNQDMVIFEKQNDKLIEVGHVLKGIQSFYVQYDSKKNSYWIGTNKGVFLLDKHFKILKHFDANNGLAGTYIYGLLLDDEGNIWCSHQRGLSSIRSGDYSILNLDKNDGIQDWDFNNRAYLKGSDGVLYFGGMNGVNYFKPPLQPKQFYQPEVYIDEILVNDKIYMSEVNANSISQLSLSYLENHISLKAIVKDLEMGKSQQIIYRLSQKQTGEWNFLPSNSSLVFNNLASGSYSLELGVYNKFNPQKIVSKTLKISISTPFYNQFYFWLLLGFLSALAGFWVYNRQKTRKQRVKFEQELALEKQRTKITADLHDDIGSSLSSLQVNSAVASQLLKKDPQKAKIVLEKIEEQSKRIGETLGDLIWSMKPGKDEVMDFGTKIKNFANDILGSTNINYEMKIDKNVNLNLSEIYLRKNLIFIAKEAINNAAKYSKSTELLLSCRIIEDSIRLEIKDNGIGFESSTERGNGLKNIKDRVAEMNGKVEINTNHNMGCQIIIDIPLSLNLGTKH